MTASTIIKAATPRNIPKIDIKVMIETKTCLRFALMYLLLMKNS